MTKFKVHRLSDWRELEGALNSFGLGEIIDYTLTMPDYRVVLLVIRYREPDKKAKDDKPTE
jgi:hypothetical protein